MATPQSEVKPQPSVDVPVVASAPAGAKSPLALEMEHVHTVYDAIASHFSSTRYKPWPRVREFADQLPPGSLVADVGCGNGKNLCLSDSSFFVGCDRSVNLLRVASGQRLEVVVGDAISTPYRSNAFDAAMSIAVIHHFANEERRVEAIAELGRIVRPGGKILIYVWAVEQPAKKNRVVGENGDVFIPWEMHNKYDKDETVYKRYYHLFRKGELEAICLMASAAMKTPADHDRQTSCAEKMDTVVGDATTSKPCKPCCQLVVESSFYDKENWCVVLCKQVNDSARSADKLA